MKILSNHEYQELIESRDRNRKDKHYWMDKLTEQKTAYLKETNELTDIGMHWHTEYSKLLEKHNALLLKLKHIIEEEETK